MALQNIIEIFNSISESGLSAEFLGPIEQSTKTYGGGEMRLYSPKSNAFSRASVYENAGELSSVVFSFSGFQLKIVELESVFGPLKSAYNFRDDFTFISFDGFNPKRLIKRVTTQIDGQIKDLRSSSVVRITFEF